MPNMLFYLYKISHFHDYSSHTVPVPCRHPLWQGGNSASQMAINMLTVLVHTHSLVSVLCKFKYAKMCLWPFVISLKHYQKSIKTFKNGVKNCQMFVTLFFVKSVKTEFSYQLPIGLLLYLIRNTEKNDQSLKIKEQSAEEGTFICNFNCSWRYFVATKIVLLRSNR